MKQREVIKGDSKMKKIISSILVVLVLLTLCSCGDNGKTKTDLPEESITSSNSNTTQKKEELIYNSTEAFDYSEFDDGIVITHFVNHDNIEYDKIIIPEKIDGKDVIGIGFLDSQHRIFGAIYGECEVVIPSSVKYIAGMAFNGSKGLVKLSGGENCTTIGEYAFMNCENLSEITFIDNVTNLADNAFAGCTKWQAEH